MRSFFVVMDGFGTAECFTVIMSSGEGDLHNATIGFDISQPHK